eukprot:TRINITY_DN123892_c1_g1_i1.p2 TRINITY_DN123892_c1_g1~~TRINITY_DN123892_c1_g1_i1.p2  ORF type:complete len:208 (-),score=25.68 TRINITY_DN123892_c1_g1_i1:112-735(-)
MHLYTEDLDFAFSGHKLELYPKYCHFQKGEFLSLVLLKKLTVMDDQMIELALTEGQLLNSIAIEIRKPSIDPFITMHMLENIMESRAIYLEMILTHPVWGIMKEALGEGEFRGVYQGIAKAVLAGCKVATAKQLWMMVEEGAMLKAVAIIARYRHTKKDMEAIRIARTKLEKIMDKEKSMEIEKCVGKLEIIVRRISTGIGRSIEGG